MTEELTLYTNPMSRGRTARWMLEEVGVPYRTEIVDFATIKSSRFLAINPMGKVPVLRHGDLIVSETAAICAYLADAFPEAALAPAPGDPARGSYYRWLFFAAGPLEAAVSNHALGFEPPPERRRMMGYGCWDDVLSTLETAVSGGAFLAGDAFTAADLYLGSHLGFGMMFGTIEKRPSFEAYWARLSLRPAAIRAKNIDDSLSPKAATA
jgi:glutathione S-transferase